MDYGYPDYKRLEELAVSLRRQMNAAEGDQRARFAESVKALEVRLSSVSTPERRLRLAFERLHNPE